MTLPTHILLGGVIAKLAGDPVLAISTSVLVDIDHLFSYVKSGVIYNPKKFWKTIADKKDAYGDQRGYLHNIGVALGLSFLVWLVFPDAGLTFTLAYVGHLILDALDTSDYWPLYPKKNINIKGFVDYFSPSEVVVDFILFIVLVIIVY